MGEFPKSRLTKDQEEQAKLLRAQGIPFVRIAERFGVNEPMLRQRAIRHKWVTNVTEAEKLMQKSLQDTLATRMSQEIDECIAGAIELAKEGLNGLRSNKTKGMKPKDLREYAGALKELVAVQRQALGIGDKVGTQINIGIVDNGGFGACSTGDTPAAQGNETPPGQQTIEIESV